MQPHQSFVPTVPFVSVPLPYLGWRDVLTASSQYYQPWTSSPMMDISGMGYSNVSAPSSCSVWRSATNDRIQQPASWTFSGPSYAAVAAPSNVSASIAMFAVRNSTNDALGLCRFQATTARQCGDCDQSTDFRQATCYGHCCSIDNRSLERGQPDQPEGRRRGSVTRSWVGLNCWPVG